LMGGSITVHSQFGAGSAFVIRLPLANAASDHVTPQRSVPLTR
jgi:signal transduction histidine kinase